MRISFLAPQLPPAVCGIADHTRCLAAELRSEGVEVGFIHREPSRAGRGLPEGPIDAWDGGARSLQECVRRQQPDWLWVQLSGYGYSRWGAPLRLGRALRQLRRRLPDVGLAVFAHETHCQPHQLGRKGRLLSPWQRYTVGTVVRQADLVFTSIPKYLRQITHDYDFPSDRVVRLPIGSSVPPVYLTQTERRQRRKRLGWGSEELVAVTFGSFGSQLRALRGCGNCLARGQASGQLQRVVCIGGAGAPPAKLMGWTERLGGPARFQVLGHQAESDVAEVLACCDFAFSAYPTELLGKSTVFSAFALAGLAVLVSDGSTARPDPDSFPVLPVSSWDWGNARSAQVEQLRQDVRNYALTDLSWPSIGHRALAALKTSAGPRGEQRGWAVTN